MKTKIRHTIQNNLHHSAKIPDNVSAKENANNSEDNSSTNSRESNSKVTNLGILDLGRSAKIETLSKLFDFYII